MDILGRLDMTAGEMTRRFGLYISEFDYHGEPMTLVALGHDGEGWHVTVSFGLRGLCLRSMSYAGTRREGFHTNGIFLSESVEGRRRNCIFPGRTEVELLQRLEIQRSGGRVSSEYDSRRFVKRRSTLALSGKVW